jgi:hypothetical protein
MVVHNIVSNLCVSEFLGLSNDWKAAVVVIFPYFVHHHNYF